MLRTTYDALHPGLARYTTQAELDAAYADLVREAERDRTLAEAFLALVKFTAKIRCGHTYPNFFNQPARIQRALFEGPHVPFAFRWLDGHMVVTANLGADARLHPGTEILRLNGVAASEVLERLLPLARADGSNDAKRIEALGVSANAAYEAFDIYHPLVFPWAGSELSLEVRQPDGTTAAFTTPAQTHAERLAALSHEGDPDSSRPMWSLTFVDAKTGYLKMPSWVTYKSTWDWKGDLQRAAEALVARKATGLIVDVRGNEGGEDVGNELLRHLVDKELPVRSSRRIVRYRTVPLELRPALDTWDKSFFAWGAEAHELGDGRFELVNKDHQDDVIAPLGPRFRGHVVVLVDAANSSATFQFAALVQRHHLATLIGEPTGGNQRGINGGAFFFLRLPRTGLEVDLPLIGTFARVDAPEPPDAGIVPDVVVTTTAQDIARGRDPQLDAARAHLSGSSAHPSRR